MQNPNTDKQLLWSPFKDDEFILYGNNILFYKITGFDSSFNRNRVDSNLFVSDNSYAKLVGSINNYQGQKLLSWYPSEIGYNNYHLIALHEMSQDQIRLLSLSSFNSSENLADNEINILKMEHARVSNQLKWQPIWQSSLLGLGCEEYEDASSIYIFDINRPNKHVYELSEFSSCLSLCWHPENSDILFAGVASQNISLFDFRVGSGAAEMVHTGFVRAFSIDPKNAYRAVSHEGARIAVWDLRKFGCGPVGLMEEQKAVKCMQFCPAKADRLAVLTENSNYVNVYRIEERDEHIYKQTVNYIDQKNLKNLAAISSFSWHSKDYNRLMVNFNTFNVLMDLTVADHCPIGFSVNDELNIGINDKVLRLDKIQTETDVDIGDRMKMRALNSYGVQDFLLNLNLISNDRSENDLRYLWTWFDLSKKLFDKRIPYIEKYIGIKTLLQLVFMHEPKNGNPTINEINKKYIFEMCGWNNWKELVSRLEAQKEYERAACICVFNKDLKRAIEVLNGGSKSSSLNEYLALSLALSFISKNGIPDLKDSYEILNKITDPYLKVLFQYQMNSENFDPQIIDTQILIPDQVCIALTSFKKDQLMQFIAKLTSDCIKYGNLYGILLTGLSSECVDLFQNYIRRTSDVQTPAVAVIHNVKTITNKYVVGWIESYRELLDSWMLWEQRAHYDINKNNIINGKKIIDPKVYLKCNFCGDNISTKSHKKGGPENNGSAIGMTCQACQKQLLRCTVCSFIMNIDPPKSTVAADSDKLSHWFVFCQKCSHGGHLGHLVQWFKTDPECPLITCNCQCYISEGIFDE